MPTRFVLVDLVHVCFLSQFADYVLRPANYFCSTLSHTPTPHLLLLLLLLLLIAGMNNVAPPTRDATYEIKAAMPHDESSAVTQYVPGQLVEIWINVVKQRIHRKKYKGKLICYCGPYYREQPDIVCTAQKRFGFTRKVDKHDGNGLVWVGPWSNCTEPFMESSKYIGLLLYAVDANEVKVGSWEIPYQAPPQFWTPPDTGCGGISLMHADAQPKSYKHHFSFRAPAAATGKVRKVSLSLELLTALSSANSLSRT